MQIRNKFACWSNIHWRQFIQSFMIDTQKLCILQTRIDIFWVKICGISLNVTFFFRQLNGFADELRCMMVPFGNNIHDYTTLEGSQIRWWSGLYFIQYSFRKIMSSFSTESWKHRRFSLCKPLPLQNKLDLSCCNFILSLAW